MDKALAIEMKHVWLSYNGYPVLENVDLVIPERDLVCIVGPNGGGKTTLLKLILGIVKPSKGVVRVFGRPPEKSRPRMGYMPQHAAWDPQFPATAIDVVMMARLGRAGFFGRYSRKDKKIAEKVMEQVRIYHLRDMPFSTLSGGQRQRVLIARALACEPDLLLLDEPTSNLDVGMEGEFYDLLRDLNQRLTVVMVSHDLGFVSKLVKSVVCVKCQVSSHPTSEITNEIIDAMYGSQMRIVRHDHASAKEVAEWRNF